MPAIARANGGDSVLSPNGTGRRCGSPLQIATGVAGQSRVFADGILVASFGDVVQPHPLPGCTQIDEQTLSVVSSRVFAMGRGVGRLGDRYGDNVITSGSSRCFSG